MKQGMTARILFVDDEAMIVRLASSILQRVGHTVTVFEDSNQAYEEFSKTPDSFDLVITDQTMPNLTGIDLTRKIHEIRPDIPVILATGFSENVDEEIAKENGVYEFIMKPFSMSGLSDAINRILLERERPD